MKKQIEVISNNPTYYVINSRKIGIWLEGVIKKEDLSVDGSELRNTYLFARIK